MRYFGAVACSIDSSELHISHRHLVFTNNNKISYNKVYPSAKINYEGQVDNFIHIKKKLGFLLSPILPDPLCRSWVTMMGLYNLVCTQPLPRPPVTRTQHWKTALKNSTEKQVSSNDLLKGQWFIRIKLPSSPSMVVLICIQLQYIGILKTGDSHSFELLVRKIWEAKNQIQVYYEFS